MTWTYWDWVLCNTLVGVGILLFTYLIVGLLLWRFNTIFYGMIAKLFNIKRCVINVNHEVIRKNSDIYTSTLIEKKSERFISKVCSWYKTVAEKNPSLSEEITTTPISDLFSKLCSGGTVNVAGNLPIDPVERQSSQNESNQEETSDDDLAGQSGILSCCFHKKADVNDRTEISSDHPAHPEYERKVLNVYGKFLTLDKKRNKFLIMTITVIVITSVIIAGFQGCFLANITVYQDGPCPFYGVMECFYGPNLTYFQCTPNSTIDFSLHTVSATCFRWIGRDTSVSDVMTQIGACTGLLTAFGAVVELLIRLLIFVFEQRPGVAAGIRRMLEKTVGINRVTQPYRCCGLIFPCHFGVLNLHLYRRPWLVIIFFIIYALLPAVAVSSIILLSYFRISITALTYIVLITVVLICCLGLLWVLWEEDEIGRILPGAWSNFEDMKGVFRSRVQNVMPVIYGVAPKKDVDRLTNFAQDIFQQLHNDADRILQTFNSHTNEILKNLVLRVDGTLPHSALGQITDINQKTSSRMRDIRQLTGSAQEIRLRKELEMEKDLGKKLS